MSFRLHLFSGFVNRLGHYPSLYSQSKNNKCVICSVALARVGGIMQAEGKDRQEGSCPGRLAHFSQWWCYFPSHLRVNLGSHRWLFSLLHLLSINSHILSPDVSPKSVLPSSSVLCSCHSLLSLSLFLCQSISPTADRLIFLEHLVHHVTPFIHTQQAWFQQMNFPCGVKGRKWNALEESCCPCPPSEYYTFAGPFSFQHFFQACLPRSVHGRR